MLGLLTGIWLRSKHSASQKALWMSIAGITGIGLGLVWNLWTSSYVLFAAGCSIAGLSICYWAVEIKQWKRGWTYFWLVFGTNAISVYVFSELLIPALDVVRGHFGAGKLSLQRYIFSACSRPSMILHSHPCCTRSALSWFVFCRPLFFITRRYSLRSDATAVPNTPWFAFSQEIPI